MERGKKLMEKWGWKNGQGLGRDNKGMTSCLVLKKNDGSANQGRIEHVNSLFQKDKAKPAAPNPDGDPALLQAFYASVGLVAPSTGEAEGEPASKRLKTDDMSGGLAPDDPDSLIAKYGAPKAEMSTPSIVSEWMPREKKKYNTGWKWPKQYDNWRWSKGTEALRFFEEMQLPKNLGELAKTVLGEGSRFPSRLADDTDCVVQLTAWGTIILRPRGTGANMSLAKRMLFQMMHPSQEGLREDIMFEEDETAEGKINDQTTLLDGLVGDRADRIREIVERKQAGGGKRNVGLGADIQAVAESEDQSKLEKREMELATSDDIVLVQSKLSDLRIATGASAMVKNGNLVLVGKEKALDRAELLTKTLIETGEWVALLEAFVVSEETKKQRRGDDGPVEQILIKVPEGVATQLIGRHLKAIERAAQAEKLKLSSKPVSGKRTLMCEGVRAAHERVKLMAKELAEKGESPMLNKYLASALARQGDAAEAETKTSTIVAPGVVAAPPSLRTLPKEEEVKQEIKTEIKVEVKTEVKEEQTEDDEVTTIREGAAPPATSVPSRAVPAMRTLPAPKLNRDVLDKDVLVDLEAPETSAQESFPPFPPSAPSADTALPVGLPAFPPLPSFPPIPGGLQASAPAEAMDDQQKELQAFIDGVTE